MHKILKFNSNSRNDDNINKQNQQQCHLIFQLPEIVEQIVQHMIPLKKMIPVNSNSSSSSGSNKSNNQMDKIYTHIYPCLFVNSLWNDCAVRYIWRYIRFNEVKSEYEQFLKLASIISQEPIEVFKFKPLSSSAASTLAVAKPPTPTHHMSSHHLFPSSSSSTSSTSSITNNQPTENISYSSIFHPILPNFITSIKPVYQHYHDPNNQPYCSQKEEVQYKEEQINVDPNDPSYYNLLNDRRYSTTTTLSTSSSTSTAFSSSTSSSSSSRAYQLGNKLRSLTLRKLKDENITEPLRYIGYYATHIQAIDFYICDHITNQSLYSYFEHGNLTFVCLAGCQLITDEGIIHLAKTCPRLEHLDLRACGKVSDVSITEIAYHASQLKHLNVGRVKEGHRITDQSIRLIALRTKITVIGLAGCHISDHSLLLFATTELGKTMERISINNCYKVTNLSIRAFIRYCPKLTVFELKECHRINDWEAIALLTENNVLLTLCAEQSRLCSEWAAKNSKSIEVKAPIK
ncbi:unnamed protein product [Cunninghamella blakesleeana]